MRNQYIIGNWKMNKNYSEAKEFFKDLNKNLENTNFKNIKIVICPSHPFLNFALEKNNFFIGSQDVSKNNDGAFTGEVSASMLSSLNIPFGIVGHSERREYHNESNEILNQKLLRLNEKNIIPIFCVGENLSQREQGKEKEVILKQLEEGLKNIDFEVIIAYEPIWAIGTGKTATPLQAQEIHHIIREWLNQKYGKEKANNTSILYGGSVKPDNSKELFSQEDIDGALIGGASLKVASFMEIINLAKETF